MIRGIERNVTIFILWMACFTNSFSTLAQFYVSPKACVQAPSSGGSNGSAPTMAACENPTYFFDTDVNAISSSWNFGTGAALTGRQVAYPFSSPGTFTVQLTRTYASGSATTVSKTVTVGQLPANRPQFNKKQVADTTVCDGKSIKLDPYKLVAPGNVTYRWFPNGETTPSIEVTKSGCYSVEVADKTSGCSYTAVINVNFCLQTPESASSSEKWFFGSGATLDFSLAGTEVPINKPEEDEGKLFLTPPTTLTDPSFTPVAGTGSNPVNTPEAVAMVHGPDRALKFYTDGQRIFTADNQALTNVAGGAVNLNLSPTSQGLAMLPKVNCTECAHQQYYVVGVDKTTQLLSYWLVDLRYNNGKGAIIEEAVPLAYPVAERLSVVFDEATDSYIVIAHEANSNKFVLIKLNASGVTTQQQAIGATYSAAQPQRSYQAISPSQKTLAVGITEGGRNAVDVYDIILNPLSLVFRNRIDLGSMPPTLYGVGFSTSDNILYASLQGNGTAANPSRLLQINLATNTSQLIASSSEIFGAVQRGPIGGDGGKYVYMAINNRSTLAYLQQPELLVPSAVGYNSSGVAVSGTTRLGLPQIVYAKEEQKGDGVQASFQGTCEGTPTILTVAELCSPLRNKVEWVFPDGSTQSGPSVSYRFKAGWQPIKVRITTFSKSPVSQVVNNQVIERILEEECTVKELTDKILIKPSPSFNIPPEVYTCSREVPPSNAIIDPKPTGGTKFEYYWMSSLGVPVPGAPPTLAVLKTPATGRYTLEIKNELGCSRKQEFEIQDKCPPIIVVPTVITPNADGLNDELDVRIKYADYYELNIYTRWGDLIFREEKVKSIFEMIGPMEKWDAKLNGKPVPAGVYPYVIRYTSKDFPDRGVMEERGTITVLHN